MKKSFEITNIYWERVYMTIEFTGHIEKGDTIALINKARTKVYPLKAEVISKNNYSVRLNMTNVSAREPLPSDEWYLIIYHFQSFTGIQKAKEKELFFQSYAARVSSSLAYRMDDLSRVYRYGKKNYAYLITFTPVLLEEKLIFSMTTSFMMKNRFPKRRRVFIEATNVKSFFKAFSIMLAKGFFQFLSSFFSAIRIKRGNNILFMSQNRNYMSENLKVLDHQLKERNLDKQFKIRYSIRNVFEHKFNLFHWIGEVYKIAKSDYIFIDDYTPIFNFFNIAKGTKLIQVWHAGIGFKSVGYSRFGKEGSPHPFISCHRKYTYALVGAKGLVEDYSEVFGIEKEAILPLGLPRLDNYLKKEEIEGFKKYFYQKYPELETKKIILFAPTYRGSGQESAYYDYRMIDFDKLYKLCGKEYVVLFKMHPFVKEKVPIKKDYQDKFYDFYNYQNINELFYVTDILITDYSSNVYEYSLMNRPVIFYAYDKEVYEISRGVQRKLDDTAPGKICKSFEEVIKTIKEKDFELEKLKKYRAINFDKKEQLSADQIIDRILLDKQVKK